MIVGDDVSQYFVVIGRAVDEVRLAEGLAVASSIILSPNAWEQCNRDDILVDKIENERAVRVSPSCVLTVHYFTWLFLYIRTRSL